MILVLVMALGTDRLPHHQFRGHGHGQLRPYQASADRAHRSACSLLAQGILSTTTKTTRYVRGASRRLSAVNWRIVGEMALAWVLTFPGCGLLGFIMAKLFMWIF